MQLPIPRINSTNYQRILMETKQSGDREKTIEDIKNVILLMPHKSPIVTNFISDLARDNAALKDRMVRTINEILETGDIHGLISASFTLRRLGVGGTENLWWVGKIPVVNPLFDGIDLAIPSDSLDKCREEAERMLETVDEESFEEVFCVVQIIKGFRFSVPECLSQLGPISRHKSLVDGIRILHREENSLYLCVLVLELAKKQGFLKILLEDLDSFDHEFRDLLLSLLFECFHSPGEENSVYISSSYTPLRTPEDLELFKHLTTENTARIMKRISGRGKVEKFFHEEEAAAGKEVLRISREEFEKTDFGDKKMFFRNFCLLGSPSISHFLTYLEIYKEHFVLDKEDQKAFLSIFFEVFGGFESFCRIVVGKMVQFKIIDPELVTDFDGNQAL
ncbi:hypothetical protein M970_080240 [Encephalitozoon cuniculi EcunIII-L]|uniref:Uncharacterized protein n=1 Tax=Encephalitozoon cuniculi TaxID=6035 RepID=M1K7R5_ENCCN|nr:hypothetical protein ECU08_0270 [Encephalitozoon cuniculi]KMV65554.1 hypothetical protein M970_080240 [Encephalitozoon cuniculi EcunIII-L]UYI26952.1 hypothetical protein J0A71_04g07970 [Encephalitozoon cuniculi]